MYLEHLVPFGFAALGAPSSFIRRLLYPRLVSFGLLANLSYLGRQGVFRKIDAIVDVGANIGQFAFMIHSVVPDINVYSFEPDPKCFSLLEKTFSKHQIPGRCFPMALSREQGSSVLNVYESSANNSFLQREGETPTDSTSVRCETLDAVSREFGAIKSVFLKIDVQGAELAVLAGAKRFLPLCQLVLVEVSLTSSYTGNAKIEEVFAALRAEGFVCREIVDIYRGRNADKWGILEMDLLFHRSQ